MEIRQPPLRWVEERLKPYSNGVEKMEHRLKKRSQVSLGVTVHGRDGMTQQGTARDLSTDGMFIQLNQQAMSENVVVKIEISHDGHLYGWVAHTGDEGIGVMFRSINSHEKELIEQLCARAYSTEQKVQEQHKKP